MGNCSVKPKMVINCGICYEDLAYDAHLNGCSNMRCTYKMCDSCISRLDKKKGCPQCKSQFTIHKIPDVKLITVNGISYKDNNEGLQEIQYSRSGLRID